MKTRYFLVALFLLLFIALFGYIVSNFVRNSRKLVAQTNSIPQVETTASAKLAVHVISQLPEVQEFKELVEKTKTRKMVLIHRDIPDENGNIYVNVAEETGDQVIPRFHFFINPDTQKIQILNMPSGEMVSYEDWHAINNLVQNRDILQYYHALPKEFIQLPIQVETAEKMQTKDDFIDIKNDGNYYIRLSNHGTSTEQYAELKLFLADRPGNDVFVVANAQCIDIGCSSALLLLRYDGGTWGELGDAVYPELDQAYIQKEIQKITQEKNIGPTDPRAILSENTDSIFIEEPTTHTKLYELKWNSKKFDPIKLR